MISSFVVYSEIERKYVGACLNFDTYDEPEVVIHNNLTIIFEFLEFLEEPARYVTFVFLLHFPPLCRTNRSEY